MIVQFLEIIGFSIYSESEKGGGVNAFLVRERRGLLVPVDYV